MVFLLHRQQQKHHVFKFISVYNKTIYFSDAINKGYIYKCDINGNNIEKVSNYSAFSLNIFKDKLYFMTENNNNKLDIMCLDLVNRSVSKVKDNVGELNDVEHNNIFLNIVDDKLFFMVFL